MNFWTDIKHLYFWTVSFLLACLIGVSYEFYYVFLIPPAVFLIWILVNKPIYIVYLLALSTPLSVHLIDERYSSINLSIPTEPLIILMYLGIILKLIKAKKLPLQDFRILLSVLLLVDFSWLTITALTSTLPIISAKYVIMKSWYLVVFYFLLTKFFQREQLIKRFMWFFIAAVFVLVVYTLWQHGQEGFGRAAAYTAMRPFLPDHGMYAACISFVVPVLFVFAIHGNQLNYGPILRIICGLLFLFLVLAVALSFTRASWVSIVVSIFIYIAMLFNIRFHHLGLVGILVIGAMFYNSVDIQTNLSRNKKESDDNIENHLQSVSNVTSDPSNLERLNRWSCAMRMVEAKPIIGWGPGTYTFNYGQFQLPHQMTIISTNAGKLGGIHSEYLRPLAESGIPGAVLFISIVICVLSVGFKHQRLLTGSSKVLSLAALLGLITYFIHALLNNYSEFDKIAVPLYSFMAILSGIELNRKNVGKNHQE